MVRGGVVGGAKACKCRRDIVRSLMVHPTGDLWLSPPDMPSLRAACRSASFALRCHFAVVATNRMKITLLGATG